MITKPLNFQDVCDVTVALLKKHNIEFDQEHLYSRIAVTGKGHFEAYMSDIGITLTKDMFGPMATVRSIDDDQRWIRIKLKALLKVINEH